MGETLNLLFRSREDGTFELCVKESWSGRTVSGSFVPPYTKKQLNALQKKLNKLESGYHELREIGHRLFLALCGAEMPGANRLEASEQSVQAVLRSVIQRTIRRRGTVALTFCFGPGCDEFVRYPWELLHNGDHFLLVSGIFTLTRALLRPDIPVGCELPVRPPLRVLYIGASPVDCAPLETERSFQQLESGLAPLIDSGQVFLDRLEPPTFDQLVRYLSSYGGVSMLDDSDTVIPCYVVHFDGHGAYGRLCPEDGCKTINEADARKCAACGAALSRIKPQTYLCFCDDEGYNRFIDTQSLRDLFLSSDLRLAVFSACETATVAGENTRSQRNAVDATLATALVMAQVPAVVAMPFSLQDDLSPTFMYHFYEALADGRTLEEALSRARQALLPRQQKGWFIPVLYRHVAEGQEGPVPLLITDDTREEHEHPLSHLDIPTTFVGREQELGDLEELLTAAATGEQLTDAKAHLRLRPGTHHIALTGSAGIGKSALAFEAVRRNQGKFPGGIIGISLRGEKSFGEMLLEIIHQLRLPMKSLPAGDTNHCARLVLATLRSLASRELPCLLLLDNFEEVNDHTALETWLHFLCSLPPEVVVLVTSRVNPESMMVGRSSHCRWYEYRVGKMTNTDLLLLFAELAAASGLDQRIHMDDSKQQAILREICTLLDGYPLGAELIFGTARSIDGKVYTPEAATRSLEEVRDELRSTPLAGILAVLEVSYQRLTPYARLLLAYLSAFRLPFSREQIMLLVAPEKLTSTGEPLRLVRQEILQVQALDGRSSREEISPLELAENWRAARDELVQASFIQFDGRVYTIHPQIRHFAFAHLPVEERGRVHRVVAAYYYDLPQPGPEEWFAAFEHLESAGEPQDMQEAVSIAVRASWALGGRGYAQELLVMLGRAGLHASRLGDRKGEGQIQCCIGAILRQLGQYTEAEACLRSSLEFHREQHEQEEAGWALYELSVLFREEGNFQQASIYAQQAIELFRSAEFTQGEAWMQLVMGEVKRGEASYYDAFGHFELALTSFQDLHDKEGYALALRDRGTVFEALGQYAKALNDYADALRIFNEQGLRVGQAWVLADQAVVYIDQGKQELAEKLCGEAIAIFREQGIRRGEAWTLRALGDVLRNRHERIQARAYYDEALAIFKSIGDRVDQARVFASQGAIALEEGEYLTAQSLFEQACSIAREQGARQIMGRALRGLGDVSRALLQHIDAEHYYDEASAIATEIDAPAERCALLRRQGALCYAQQQYQPALERWVQALALDQRLGHPARIELQLKVQDLVNEQHLEQSYAESCERYALA
ncbi:tetratricopeptide repeat protein [Ktedonosporobacter rubrisoli]|uniref:Tetratricopeptide repeat protein n=1 Tax=Ktedonosporobacter rubrisoli TaxID=2509675 RepID=A0A4P6K1X2_KTERU|nr:tetratricopeptide repeat protein [Ktedonosporobacter rubrisoli]QBD82187.1 tetratricopeptide repeat protein [Ktedonosporobacter rubrisoli]